MYSLSIFYKDLTMLKKVFMSALILCSASALAANAAETPHFKLEIVNGTGVTVSASYTGTANFSIPGLDSNPIIQKNADNFYPAYLPQPPHPGSLIITFTDSANHSCVFTSDQPKDGQPTLKFTPANCGTGSFGGTFQKPVVTISLHSV